MNSSMVQISDDLQEYGLLMLGGFNPDASDNMPKLDSGKSVESVYLVGNAGSLMWPKFSRGWQEITSTDPLDHWIENILGKIASKYKMKVVFPFKGPPYLSFQQWALKLGGFSQSPLGVLIHPVYGPWLAFRGAFLSSDKESFSNKSNAITPCEVCTDKPCLSVCPVEAISIDRGYDVAACRGHLNSDSNVPCMTGCLARRVCPVGKAFRYEREHARFHMDAFLPDSQRSPNNPH